MSKRTFSENELEQVIEQSAREWAQVVAPPALHSAVLRQIRSAPASQLPRFSIPLLDVLLLALLVFCFSVVVGGIALFSLSEVRQAVLLGIIELQVWLWHKGISFSWFTSLLISLAIPLLYALASLSWQALQWLFVRPFPVRYWEIE